MKREEGETKTKREEKEGRISSETTVIARIIIIITTKINNNVNSNVIMIIPGLRCVYIFHPFENKAAVTKLEFKR